MPLARVARFENVDPDRVERIRRDIESGNAPAGLPATEFLWLHDPSTNSGLGIAIVANEEDYRRVDEVLGGVATGEAAGSRTGVTKYEVAARGTT